MLRVNAQRCVSVVVRSASAITRGPRATQCRLEPNISHHLASPILRSGCGIIESPTRRNGCSLSHVTSALEFRGDVVRL